MRQYINDDIRDNLLMVMSRVREPRTLSEISWHIPHHSLLEVGYTIDAMVLRGEVKLVLDPNAAKRYVLSDNYYTIQTARGINPELAASNLALGIGIAGAIAAVIVLWRAIPW